MKIVARHLSRSSGFDEKLFFCCNHLVQQSMLGFPFCVSCCSLMFHILIQAGDVKGRSLSSGCLGCFCYSSGSLIIMGMGFVLLLMVWAEESSWHVAICS